MQGMHADLSGVDPLIANLTHRVAIGDLLTRCAQIFGDRAALIDGKTVLTYRELETWANSVARGLLEQGLRRGEGTALLIANRWEFVVTFFACAKIGVVVLPVNLALAPADVSYQLADSGVRAVVTDEDRLPVLEAALSHGHTDAVAAVYVLGEAPSTVAGRPAQQWTTLTARSGDVVETVVEDRDALHCLYTSGTTSLPKGVITSHVAVQIGVLASALHLGLRPRGRPAVMPIVLPLFHVTGLDVLLLPVLQTGGTVVLHRGFDAKAVLEDFTRHGVTHVALLPAMWAALLAHPELSEVDTSSLQTGVYAMAPMPPERLAAIRAAFPQAEVILGSGQTETTPLSQLQWPEHQGRKDASWGPAVVTTDVRVMAPDGRLCGPGEQGELVYRSPQLMEGYWNNPEANTAAFADGWFHGGDIGYRDEGGVVWFTDRTKDMIKTGGENVSSVEVERVLLAHEDVAECAVVGTPDEYWGEAVTAYVVAAPGRSADAERLHAACKRQLAGFKVPKHYVVVDELPKTATGKIQKYAVRARHGQAHDAGR